MLRGQESAIVAVAWPLGAGRGLKLRYGGQLLVRQPVAWPLGAGRGLKHLGDALNLLVALVAWPLGAGRGLKRQAPGGA